MVVRFGPADVGRRLTLRRRLPDVPPGEPDLGDVVGVLEAWEDGVLSLRNRRGEVIQVPVDTVVAGRVVAPELSADALTAGVAHEAWRARDVSRLGDWVLRWHDGVTHPPNGALTAGDPGMPLDEALEALVAWYAERDAPATLIASDPSPMLDACVARGWPTERRTVVMSGSAAEVAAADAALPDGLRMEVTSDLPGDWYQVLPRLADPEVAPRFRELLESAPTTVFATVRDDAGAPLAVGQGGIAQGWMNLTSVEVLASARRNGLGRAVPVALARRAVELGVKHVLLQVWPDNDPARALYEQLGLTVHHEYVYCVAPGHHPQPR
jgi:ribosomal protein S18 acetylase RimI-like enzyme